MNNRRLYYKVLAPFASLIVAGATQAAEVDTSIIDQALNIIDLALREIIGIAGMLDHKAKISKAWFIRIRQEVSLRIQQAVQSGARIGCPDCRFPVFTGFEQIDDSAIGFARQALQ